MATRGRPKKQKATKPLQLLPETEIAEPEGNGQKPHQSEEKHDFKKDLKRSSIENAFSQTGHPSALDYLVNPGDNFKALLMRIVVFNGRPPGYRYLVAAMHHRMKCKRFNDVLGMEEIELILAGSPSIGGLGRDQLVKSIIGENKMLNQDQKSVGGWLKGLAFGKPKEGNSPDGV